MGEGRAEILPAHMRSSAGEKREMVSAVSIRTSSFAVSSAVRATNAAVNITNITAAAPKAATHDAMVLRYETHPSPLLVTRVEDFCNPPNSGSGGLSKGKVSPTTAMALYVLSRFVMTCVHKLTTNGVETNLAPRDDVVALFVLKEKQGYKYEVLLQ